MVVIGKTERKILIYLTKNKFSSEESIRRSVKRKSPLNQELLRLKKKGLIQIGKSMSGIKNYNLSKKGIEFMKMKKQPTTKKPPAKRRRRKASTIKDEINETTVNIKKLVKKYVDAPRSESTTKILEEVKDLKELKKELIKEQKEQERIEDQERKRKYNIK